MLSSSGERSLKKMKARLHEEIVKWMIAIENMLYPDIWEPQKEICELKKVRQGTAEWTLVEQQFHDHTFQKIIVCIERISIGKFISSHKSEYPTRIMAKSTGSSCFMALV